MKYDELKSLGLEELEIKLNEEKAIMERLRFSHSISPIENPMKIKVQRKIIAQISTELSKKRIISNQLCGNEKK